MRSRRILLMGWMAACADPVVYAPVERVGPTTDEESLLFEPARVSVQSEAGRRQLAEVTLRSAGPLPLSGVVWEGDETWSVVPSAALPSHLDGALSLQLELRTGLSMAGGELVFWGDERVLGRLPVERWEAPELALTPARTEGVGVVGSRVRLPFQLRHRGTAAAKIEWRVLADRALQVQSPAPLSLGPDAQREVVLHVEASRPGDWALRLGAIGPHLEAWAEAELHFESSEAWQLEVFAEPDQSSAWVRDLRRYATWSEPGSTELEGRTQRLVGPAEESAELGLSYLEDCRSAPSALLVELFGASLTSLVPGSAEWRRVVEEVCVQRGPLQLRWTLEQGGERTEGQAELEQRADHMHLGRWNARTRRFEVTP